MLGARPEFEDLQLGLTGLQEVYGLDNATFAPIELGEQYAALDSGEADAVDAFTTDPQLESGDYTLLDDPELLFGSQNVVMVVGEDKLDSIDADAFLNVVDTVNAELTENAMVQMNAEVTDGRDEAGWPASSCAASGWTSRSAATTATTRRQHMTDQPQPLRGSHRLLQRARRGCARSASTAARPRRRGGRAHARLGVGAGHRHPGAGRRPGDPGRAGRRRPRRRRPELQPRRAHGLGHPAVRRPDDTEFLVRERFYGAFRRAITLPEGTRAPTRSRQFDDGLVEITVRDGVSPADSTRIEVAERSKGATSRPVVAGDETV